MPSAHKARQALSQQIKAAYAHAAKAAALGALHFLQHCVIDSRPEPLPFRERAEPWQWALAAAFAPAFEHVAQVRKDYAGKMNFWVELPKGHDKSSLVARFANWALAFATAPWKGYVYAKDKEQAGYLAEAMRTEAALNPWLERRLTFRHWDIGGRHGASVTIMAADAAGAQGQRPDLLVVDEVVHWPEGKGAELFHNLVSGLRKRPCVFVVITNSGTLYTWQHRASETARLSPRWFHYHAPGRLAQWMDEAAIQEDRHLLPPAFAARLYDNVWIEPGLDCGYLTRAEVEKCEALGRMLNLTRREEGSPGVVYGASIDYGAVKDRCVLVVGHQDGTDRVLLDRMDVWQGTREAPVAIEAVERWLDETRKKFDLGFVIIDPYQMQSTIQRYARLVNLVEWQPRAGKANHEMAQTFRSLVVNEKLAWPAGLGDVVAANGHRHSLADELCELITRPYAFGYRADHLPGLHDDRYVASAMLAVQLLKHQARRKLYLSDLFF
jgi:phage terminase large subunit-like protein